MLSVVIPLYNKGPHIADTLNKVLAQTVAPLEIIVVDDGSTDHGPSVVKGYAAQGVRLIQQANQGVSAARNAGVAHARSSYVAFLDADDEWLPEHMEQLTRLIQRYPDAALFSTAHQIRRDGHLIQPRLAFPLGWSGVVEDFFGSYANGLSLVNSSTACIRKDALEAVGCFPVGVKRGEDVVAWVKMALAHPVAHASVVTAVFNQEAVNRSDLNRETQPPGSLLFMENWLSTGQVPSHQLSGFVQLFDQIALMTAAGYRLKGDTQASRSIAYLAYQAERYKTAAIISIVNFMPQMLLKWLRQRRHRTA
jgi:glycosyltransferase involved in cell wall biosynthesis